MPRISSGRIILTPQSQSALWHVLSATLAILIVTVGIAASYRGHMLDSLEKGDVVDPDSCTCTCWDGYFKGQHPRPNYLYIYFNTELPTLVIIVFAYVYISLLQAIVHQGLFLLRLGRLRWPVVPLLAVSVYSHIYGGWNIFNYVNESSTKMLSSQIFYCLTEMATTYAQYVLLDKQAVQLLLGHILHKTTMIEEEERSWDNRDNRSLSDHNNASSFSTHSTTMSPQHLHVLAVVLCSMSILHFLLAMPEKMLWSLFFSDHGDLPAARDVLLMASDLGSLALGILILKRLNKDGGLSSSQQQQQQQVEQQGLLQQQGTTNTAATIMVETNTKRSPYSPKRTTVLIAKIVVPLWCIYQWLCAFE